MKFFCWSCPHLVRAQAVVSSPISLFPGVVGHPETRLIKQLIRGSNECWTGDPKKTDGVSNYHKLPISWRIWNWNLTWLFRPFLQSSCGVIRQGHVMFSSDPLSAAAVQRWLDEASGWVHGETPFGWAGGPKDQGNSIGSGLVSHPEDCYFPDLSSRKVRSCAPQCLVLVDPAVFKSNGRPWLQCVVWNTYSTGNIVEHWVWWKCYPNGVESWLICLNVNANCSATTLAWLAQFSCLPNRFWSPRLCEAKQIQVLERAWNPPDGWIAIFHFEEQWKQQGGRCDI